MVEFLVIKIESHRWHYWSRINNKHVWFFKKTLMLKTIGYQLQQVLPVATAW